MSSELKNPILERRPQQPSKFCRWLIRIQEVNDSEVSGSSDTYQTHKVPHLQDSISREGSLRRVILGPFDCSACYRDPGSQLSFHYLCYSGVLSDTPVSINRASVRNPTPVLQWVTSVTLIGALGWSLLVSLLRSVINSRSGASRCLFLFLEYSVTQIVCQDSPWSNAGLPARHLSGTHI